MEQIFKDIRSNRLKQLVILFFAQLLPNIDFYYRLSTESLNWEIIRAYLPMFLYSLMTAFLLIEWIKAKADNYDIKNTQKDLMRLNQLYKERFKMIRRNELKELFGTVEKERWRKRLYEKEPSNKMEVDDFVERQYNFTHLSYGDELEIKPN